MSKSELRFEIKGDKLEMQLDGVTKTMPASDSTRDQVADIARPHLPAEVVRIVDKFTEAGLKPVGIIVRCDAAT